MTALCGRYQTAVAYSKSPPSIVPYASLLLLVFCSLDAPFIIPRIYAPHETGS